MAHTAKLLVCDVVCIEPGKTAAEAARLMEQEGVGSVLVGTVKTPEGIFTERDLARRVVAKGLDPAKTPVSAVATKELVTVEVSAPLDQVFAKLAEGRFRHLPIAEGGEIVGMVSLTDLAKVLQEVYREDKYLQFFAHIAAGR